MEIEENLILKHFRAVQSQSYSHTRTHTRAHTHTGVMGFFPLPQVLQGPATFHCITVIYIDPVNLTYR